MRTLLSFLTAATLLFSCGEAGVGFNLSTEFPVDAPLEIAIPTTPEGLTDLLDINPPSQSLEYSLGSVDAFSSDLDNLGDVVINSISYEISGIDATEAAIELDEFDITLIIGGVNLPLVATTGGQLSNVAKTPIALSDAELDQLVSQLVSGGGIGADVIFDLASIPDGLTNLTIDYTMYFDVTIKVKVD